MKRRRHIGRARRGFTLIELSLALAIAAMTIAIGVTATRAITDAALHSTAVELTGAIKYSYDRAVMQRRTQRLAIDLDQRVWWIDFTETPFSLSAERTTGTHGEKIGDLEAEGEHEDEHKSIFDDEPDEVAALLEGGHGTQFTPEEDDIGKPRPLPSDVSISRVWTGHQEEAFTTGVAYIHFFKGGWTEPAIIELVDCEWNAAEKACAGGEEADVVSLKLSPLTGRVRTYQESLEVPEHEEIDGRDEGDL